MKRHMGGGPITQRKKPSVEHLQLVESHSRPPNGDADHMSIPKRLAVQRPETLAESFHTHHYYFTGIGKSLFTKKTALVKPNRHARQTAAVYSDTAALRSLCHSALLEESMSEPTYVTIPRS